MKSKTLEQLEKRRYHKYKEVHILDTSVVVGAIKAMVDGKKDPDPTLRYFAKVKNGVYLAFVTPVMLGEAFFVLRRDIEPSVLGDAMGRLMELLDNEHIRPFFPDSLSGLMAGFDKVKVVEDRCSTTDARIAAEGIALKDRARKTAEIERLNCFLVSTERKQGTEYLKVKLVTELA